MTKVVAIKKARRSGVTEDGRRRLIIAVRAACKRQGIDDDMRKDMQVGLIGKASMSDMDLTELGRLLDHLNKGWKGPMGHRAHIGKIKALWWSLYWLGAIDDPGDRAISAFVERQTGVSALKFLDHRKAHKVIEALKSWLTRNGVLWPSPQDVAAIAAHSPAYREQHDRHAVLEAIGRRLRDRHVLLGHYSNYLEGALGLSANHYAWGAAELDTGIRMLGRKARRAEGRD